MFGKADISFAALPNGSPFDLTAPITGGPHQIPRDGYFTNWVTTAQDGAVVMDDETLVNFHVRGLLQWAHWVLAQLPAHLHIHIKPDAFLSAFTFKLGDKRVRLRDWNLAPAASVLHPYTDEHVDAQRRMLHDLYDHSARALSHFTGENPFLDNYLNGRRPLSRPTSEAIPFRLSHSILILFDSVSFAV